MSKGITTVGNLIEHYVIEQALNLRSSFTNIWVYDLDIQIVSKDNVEIIRIPKFTTQLLTPKVLWDEEIIDSWVQTDNVFLVKQIKIMINKNYVDYIMS